jgi:hypothetical protein
MLVELFVALMPEGTIAAAAATWLRAGGVAAAPRANGLSFSDILTLEAADQKVNLVIFCALDEAALLFLLTVLLRSTGPLKPS